MSAVQSLNMTIGPAILPGGGASSLRGVVTGVRDCLGEGSGFEGPSRSLMNADLVKAVVTLNDWKHAENTEISPGLIPGLFAIKSGIAALFVRLSCRRLRSVKIRNTFYCKGFWGSGAGVRA